MYFDPHLNSTPQIVNSVSICIKGEKETSLVKVEIQKVNILKIKAIKIEDIQKKIS